MAMEEESVVVKFSAVGAKDVEAANKKIGDAAKAAKEKYDALQDRILTFSRQSTRDLDAVTAASRRFSEEARAQAQSASQTYKAQSEARKAFYNTQTQQMRAALREQASAQKSFESEQRARASAYRKEMLERDKAFYRQQTQLLREAKSQQKAQDRADTANIRLWGAEWKSQVQAKAASLRAAAAEQRAQDAADRLSVRQWGAEWRAQLQAKNAAARSAAAALRAQDRADIALVRQWGNEWKAQIRARDAAMRASHQQDMVWIRAWSAEWKKQNAANAKAAALAQRGPAAGGKINLGFAGTLINAFLGITLVKSIAELADEYLTLRNRLKLVTESTDQANGVFKETVQIANNSRTSLAAVGQLYQRLSTSIQGLPITNRQILEITDSIAKAATIGGSNALETEKGLFQLTQGLARGVLRGDELRSILEQLPGVADVLAKKFGVARGELSKMGEQGKITTKVIVEAFLEQRKTIDEQFSKTVPTLSGAFQIAKNNVIVFFGEVEQRSGVLTTIAKGILLIGTNIELIARIALAGALVKAINLVKDAFISLITVSGLTPGGIMFKGLVLLTGLVVAFGDEIKIVGTRASVLDVIAVIFERIEKALRSIYNLLPSVNSQMDELSFGQTALGPKQSGFSFGSIPILGDLFGGVVDEASARGVNNDFERGYADKKKELLFPNYLNQLAKGASGTTEGGVPGAGAGRGRKSFADYMREAREQLLLEQQQGRQFSVNNEVLKVRKALRGEISAAQEEELRGIYKQIQAQKEFNGIRDLREETFKNVRLNEAEGDNRSVLEARFAFAEKAGISEGQITKDDGKQIESLVRIRTEGQRYYDMLRQINGSHVEYSQNLKTLRQLYDNNRISLEQYTTELMKMEREQLRFSTDLKSGLQGGLYDIQIDAERLGATAGERIAQGFNQAGDALTEFVLTGKNGFKDLVTSILSDLARLAIQKAIIAPLASALTGALGGITSPSAAGSSGFNTDLSGLDLSYGATPRAKGGPIDYRQLSLVGEKGPELFVPSTSGHVYNTDRTRKLLEGGGGNVTVAPPAKVTITHINNAAGTKSETKQSKGPGGEDMIEIITSAVDARQMQNAQRGVGAMPTVLRQHGIRSQGMHR